MDAERYLVNCPTCGPVEGVVPPPDSLEDRPGEVDVDSEEEIIQETMETSSGPHLRIRCPRCGAWLEPDRAEPV